MHALEIELGIQLGYLSVIIKCDIKVRYVVPRRPQLVVTTHTVSTHIMKVGILSPPSDLLPLQRILPLNRSPCLQRIFFPCSIFFP